jgi:hypothetical protein
VVIPTAFVEMSPTSGREVGPTEAAGPGQRDPGAAQQVLGVRPEPAPTATLDGPGQQELAADPQPQGELQRTEQRLRAMGAVYYSLESWGSGKEYYRFLCRMPIGGSLTAIRYFEATGPDPLKAMSQVLEDIETWRAGRR